VAFRIVLIIAGSVLAFMGWQEYGLLQQSSAEPQPIELSQLEAGQAPPSLHIQLGHHWKLWPEFIYSYRLKEGQEEGPDTRVDYVYYPIISEGHPHSQAFDRLAERYEAGEELTQADWPVLKSFAMLVRTKQFERVRDLPTDGEWGEADQMVGMVVNDIRRLDAEEKSLLLQSYTSLDLGKVLIFEEGRQPESMAYCLGMMALGGGLVLLGFYLIVRSTTGRREEAGDLPPLIKSAELAR